MQCNVTLGVVSITRCILSHIDVEMLRTGFRCVYEATFMDVSWYDRSCTCRRPIVDEDCAARGSVTI